MKTYPMIEAFYSLKGEGLWTGTPMLFLRFAGCNLACQFCDTPAEKQFAVSADEILAMLDALSLDCRRIVITGGEPNIHNLSPLLNRLHAEGYSLHMETNGLQTKWIESNIDSMDFLTLSPKTTDHLCQKALNQCDEIKYLYPGFIDINAIEKQLTINHPKRYILPIAKAYQNGIGRNTTINQNIEQSIAFCKANPDFSLCLQVHKYLQIP